MKFQRRYRVHDTANNLKRSLKPDLDVPLLMRIYWAQGKGAIGIQRKATFLDIGEEDSRS